MQLTGKKGITALNRKNSGVNGILLIKWRHQRCLGGNIAALTALNREKMC